MQGGYQTTNLRLNRAYLQGLQIKKPRNRVRGFCKSQDGPRRPALHQLRVWSTSLFLAIQGIMARS